MKTFQIPAGPPAQVIKDLGTLITLHPKTENALVGWLSMEQAPDVEGMTPYLALSDISLIRFIPDYANNGWRVEVQFLSERRRK